MDPYKTLGVSRDATQSEINKAFRTLSRQFHPDCDSSPEAAERYKLITFAYEILSDEKRRVDFDEHGIGGLDTRQEAISLIGTLVVKLIDKIMEAALQELPVSLDVVDMLRKGISASLQVHRSEILRLEKGIKVIGNSMARIRAKDNLLSQMFEVQVKELQKALSHILHVVEVEEAAARIVNDHKFEVDKSIVITNFHGNKWSSNTFSW